ncbi:hypothetical protein ACDL92_12050 [Ihubacter sp. mB4P-1]|uniref:hypothetical protein n=1 Tax=Ihubacter sp. mB4P-1 TaxID=3242370 RepID=UPI003C7B08FC
MKKVISMLLIMSLLLGMGTMAFAEEGLNINKTTNFYFENECFDKKVDTLDAMIIPELNTLCTKISVVEKSGKNIEYAYTFKNGVEGYVKETFFANGDIKYYFKEGALENIVIRKSDGTLLLDGEEVSISIKSDSVSENRAFAERQQDAEPQGKHYNKTAYVDSPPSGTTRDDYSVFVNTYGVDVDFNKAVKSLTVGAIITILTGGVLGVSNLGAVAGTLTSLATGFVGGVATTLQSDHPLSVGSKIEIKRWQHKNGYQISHSSAGEARFVYKDILNYYARSSSGSYKYFDYALKYRVTRIYSS